VSLGLHPSLAATPSLYPFHNSVTRDRTINRSEEEPNKEIVELGRVKGLCHYLGEAKGMAVLVGKVGTPVKPPRAEKSVVRAGTVVEPDERVEHGQCYEHERLSWG
jgi:hypothetical protein